MARRARLPIRFLAVSVAGVSLTTGIVAAVPAHAQSIKVVKAQIASAERQLHELNVRSDAASERYDAARIKLSDAAQKSATAQIQVKAAQAEVAKMEQAASSFAVAAYEGGTQSAAVSLATGTTQKFLGQVNGLQAVSSSQAQALAGVEAAQRTEAQAQVNAAAALAIQQSATKSLAADRQQILAAATKEQQLLTSLQAKEAALIKAAKAAKAKAAAIAAEQRRARALAAQKLANEQAAAALRRQAAAVPAPDPVSHPTTTTHPSSHPSTPSGPVSAAGGAATAVEWAHKELGKPYVWAAAGPNSFDCSGLTQYVWGKAGVYLDHYTGDQWNEGTHVSQSQLEPGDLVFFAYDTSDPSTIHHVGIYIGGGNMIDAPYTGTVVQIQPYDQSDYIGAVRP